jgi:arginine/ornithine transport system permease protein
MVMHATSIASAVTIVELTRTARDVYYNTLMPLEAFGLVAVFYFVITFTLVGLVKLLEWRFLRHLRPRPTDATAVRA